MFETPELKSSRKREILDKFTHNQKYNAAPTPKNYFAEGRAIKTRDISLHPNRRDLKMSYNMFLNTGAIEIEQVAKNRSNQLNIFYIALIHVFIKKNNFRVLKTIKN